MTPLQHAQTAFINASVGAVYKIGATLGSRNHFYQLTVTGIIAITPGAYCRAIGVA